MQWEAICRDWPDKSCVTPLGITFGAIELPVLYASICKVGYFMYKLGRLYCTCRGFDLFTSLGKCNHIFLENKIMRELTFLDNSSTLSLRNIAQISSHPFWANYPIFIVFHVYLTKASPLLHKDMVHKGWHASLSPPLPLATANSF